MTTEVPVLIVGGGPVGLTTSLLLGRRGVGSLLVERHPGTSVLPRASVISVRGMEILRSLGLEAAVRRAAVSTLSTDYLIVSRSLTGKPQDVIPPLQHDTVDISPTQSLDCAQDVLEPLIVAEIGKQPASRLLFNAELTDFHESDRGVEATIKERSTGVTQHIRARYLVAADGAHSSIRQRLGISMRGRGAMGRYHQILFRADVDAAVPPRRAVLYRISGTNVNGMLRRADGDGRWLLATQWTGEATPQRCAALVREAVGDAKLQVEILRVDEWVADAKVADRFRAGDVFLAGDAAHLTTPAGGLGMNTGLQEAHNLGWKLAAVAQGWAGPQLLDTYDIERRPVAGIVVRESARLMVDGSRSIAKTLGLALGHHYESGALIPDASTPPRVQDSVTTYVPCARPGHRAPHLWLDPPSRSTLDLFGDGLTLLTASPEAWRQAAAAAQSMRVPLVVHGVDVPGWSDLYGVERSGAVLVRPDGYVAARWKGCPGQPSAKLTETVRAMLRHGWRAR